MKNIADHNCPHVARSRSTRAAASRLARGNGRLLAALWSVTLWQSSFAATATFTAVGPTSVPAGTSVVFDVTIAVETLASFDSADIIIGANGATDVSFAYAPAWGGAFANVTTPTFDNGFYNQDVFVGGNNATPVGTALLVGTVTIHTSTMTAGAYTINVDFTLDTVSTIGLAGQPESLFGTAAYNIVPPASDACCLPSGDCAPVDPTQCAAMGGVAHPGLYCRLHADIDPEPYGSGIVDVDDLIRVIAGFADYAAAPNADIYPCEGPNGIVDVDDLIMLLEAFAGNDSCPDFPCQ